MTNIIKETSRGYQGIAVEDEMFRKRIIFFYEPVEDQSSANLIMQLLQLESEAPGEPITLYINSPGGDVNSGLGVISVMESMRSPVTTVCMGICASMASLIFLAGTKRLMLEKCRIMIHDPFLPGKISSDKTKPLVLQETLERLMQMREDLAKYIAERSGNSLEDILKLTAKDHYMNSEEALKLGIATAIADFKDGSEGSLVISSNEYE